jgi:hypothetical protein
MKGHVLSEYTNPKNPGSFSGLSGFLKNNKNIKKKHVVDSLLREDSFTLHTPLKKNFPRTQWLSNGIDHIWQIDLVDMKKLKYVNSHNEYILTVIDVFSKKAWAQPIKKKTPVESVKVMADIFNEGRIPKVICLDNGNEFKGVCKELFKKHNIKIVPSTTKLKASVVERFNRTLKEKMYRVFTYRKNKKYVDILKDLIDSYNNSYHSSIKTTPNSVNKSNENKIHKILYGDLDTFSFDNYIKFKYDIGDYVRISIDKTIFDKGYTPNFSKEIYIVEKKLPSNPPRYNIKSINGEEFSYNYYTEELQKVLKGEFPYDTYKIHKEDKNKLLIEKLNSNTSDLHWIDKKSL